VTAAAAASPRAATWREAVNGGHGKIIAQRRSAVALSENTSRVAGVTAGNLAQQRPQFGISHERSVTMASLG